MKVDKVIKHYFFLNCTIQCTLQQENLINNLISNNKIYSKIDQHSARHFVYYGACLSNPPLFLCSQIIISFLNSKSHQSGNRIGILANCRILINDLILVLV